MEMIVVFNNGRSAAAAGMARVAPDKIYYPLTFQNKQVGTEVVALDGSAKSEWLVGYDAHFVGARAARNPRTSLSRVGRSVPA